jgi:hypothetical protein
MTEMVRSRADVVDWSARARRWTLVLLAAGVAWRLVRYGLGFPLWGDEAALLLNVVERHGYAELLRPLAHEQVAPLGFLAAEYTAVREWGTSEYAVRLFPLIAGLAGLFAFARLAWLALPPVGAMCAVGVLAATHYVTRYSLDAKPYGTDLLVAAGLLLLAVRWSRTPEQQRWLALLVVVAPVGLLFSYPGVFVAGAISVGLLPILLRRRSSPVDWALFAAYNAAIVVTFAGLWHLSVTGQFEQTRSGMLRYWVRGFPPADPLRFVVWLVDVHTAEMMSYPLGGKHGASALTAVLCFGGAALLLLRGQRDLVRLLGWIFVLTFAAAALRRYPYGGSARVAQHLAPAICLFVGASLEAIIRAFQSARQRRTAGAVAGLVLLGLIAAGAARDVLHPYHTKGHQRVATLLSALKRDHGPDSGVWLMDRLDSMPFIVQWYVLDGVAGDRGRLDEGSSGTSVLTRHREWWVLNLDPDRAGKASVPPRAQLSEAGYVLRHTGGFVLSHTRQGSPKRVLELERWERAT